MIDSTNPRILANNIRKLFAMVKAIVPGTAVEGNPTGSGYTNLLKKIKIGDSKYKLPDEVTANPETTTSEVLSKIGIGSDKYLVTYDYSNTEKKIGKKWLNGSDMYEITTSLSEAITLTSSTSESVVSTAHTMSPGATVVAVEYNTGASSGYYVGSYLVWSFDSSGNLKVKAFFPSGVTSCSIPTTWIMTFRYTLKPEE